jgi:hypothetical protein
MGSSVTLGCAEYETDHLSSSRTKVESGGGQLTFLNVATGVANEK